MSFILAHDYVCSIQMNEIDVKKKSDFFVKPRLINEKNIDKKDVDSDLKQALNASKKDVDTDDKILQETLKKSMEGKTISYYKSHVC
jgi:hypothetical protein